MFGPKKTLIEDEIRAELLNKLREARHQCETVGLRVSVLHFDDVIEHLRSQEPIIRKELESIAAELHKSVKREMQCMAFFRLSAETQHYFDVADGFGHEVGQAFPSAVYDIQEAGNCLALGRGTACVYHCMRVLEYGLCALADKFGIAFEHKSWSAIIEPLEHAIRQIKNQPKKPRAWKANEQFYSEAAAQFMYFKNAWRNYTAHKEFKYTEAEAEAIFRHVRDFMQHIAKRLREKKPKC
jgi:hypothetical protein